VHFLHNMHKCSKWHEQYLDVAGVDAVNCTHYSQNSSWLVTSRLDTTRHVRRAEPMRFGCVQLVEQHGTTLSTHWTCRDVTWRAKWNGLISARYQRHSQKFWRAEIKSYSTWWTTEGQPAFSIKLTCRCSGFIVKCLNSSYSYVRFVARQGVLRQRMHSPIGRNAQHSATLLGTPLPKLASINKKMAWTIVNNSVLSHSDFSNMNIIRELLHIKHNFANMTLYSNGGLLLLLYKLDFISFVLFVYSVVSHYRESSLLFYRDFSTASTW